MSDSEHPAKKFIEPLKDLAEGRTEPVDWLIWWSENREEVESLVPRGWFLKVKPMTSRLDNPYQAASDSQKGACYILKALGVTFVESERYHLVVMEEFRKYCEEQDAIRKQLKEQYAPQLTSLGHRFPKLARCLKKNSENLDALEPPATEEQISAFEEAIGIPLPMIYREFLQCTRQLKIDRLSIGLDDTWAHPVSISTKSGTSASLCIAEYWLEADGDQLLLEWTTDPEDDPDVFYYAHEDGPEQVRPLKMSLSKWLESLPRSPVFRDL